MNQVIADTKLPDYKPHMNVAVPKSVNKKRIAVAMSGGVDSSVTAAILVGQGYEVVGLTMQLYDHGNATAKSKACCAGQDIYDARRVADKIGIPHYVLDYEERFEADVIAPFVQSYLRGETPIPCVLCNQTVKFRDLIDAAKEIGATTLATGHYIRRSEGVHGPALLRAKDLDRDQSYFLFATTRDQLEYLRFPLGDLPKSETRTLAEKFGLKVADKPDSQDICFVPTGRYSDIVRKKRGGTDTRGRFMHIDGRDMGDHKGIENYTVGQRRGLGLGGETAPLYVVEVDPEENIVVVGPKHALAKMRIQVRDINWLGLGNALPKDGVAVQARIRNSHDPVTAFVRPDRETGLVSVEFEEALYGISPGQACVFYDGDCVLGGGWIIREDTNQYVSHYKRIEAITSAA